MIKSFNADGLREAIIAGAIVVNTLPRTNISGIMADIMHSCKDFKVKEVRATLDGMVAEVYEPLSDMSYELKITPRRTK